jgi:hypothetical protein
MMVMMESYPSEGGNGPPMLTNEDKDQFSNPFNINAVDGSELKKICDKNEYIKALTKGSYLSLLQESKIKNAFKRDNEKGLFHLIFTQSFFDACLKWTNDELSGKGKSKVSKDKFMAYVGLEIAMSLVPLNSIAQYWESKTFSGHEDFKKTMSRNDFQEIRAVSTNFGCFECGCGYHPACFNLHHHRSLNSDETNMFLDRKLREAKTRTRNKYVSDPGTNQKQLNIGN